MSSDSECSRDSGKAMVEKDPKYSDENTPVTSSTGHVFNLVQVLGAGAFGRVYKAKRAGDDKKRFAVKLELNNQHNSSADEIAAMAAVSGRRQFCQLVEHGTTVDGTHTIIVMSLLSETVEERLKHYTARKGTFSLETALRIGDQTLKAIRSLQEAGFLSLDIKPSNFAFGRHDGLESDKVVYMIDFGLSKRFRNQNGDRLPRGVATTLRLTPSYASRNAMATSNVSPRDDMESWFYMLLRLTTGALPWRVEGVEPEFMDIWNKKFQMAMDPRKRAEFLAGCPKVYKKIYVQICTTPAYLDPDYEKLGKRLRQAAKAKKIDLDRSGWKWEWFAEHIHSNYE